MAKRSNNMRTLRALALHCLALPCIALCLALPCIALHCLALPCIALHCLALPCPACLGLMICGGKSGDAMGPRAGSFRTAASCPKQSDPSGTLLRLSAKLTWQSNPLPALKLASSAKPGRLNTTSHNIRQPNLSTQIRGSLRSLPEGSLTLACPLRRGTPSTECAPYHQEGEPANVHFLRRSSHVQPVDPGGAGLPILRQQDLP